MKNKRSADALLDSVSTKPNSAHSADTALNRRAYPPIFDSRKTRLDDQVIIKCPLLHGTHQIFICRYMCKYYEAQEEEACTYQGGA
jgi:hypothetical protein